MTTDVFTRAILAFSCDCIVHILNMLLINMEEEKNTDAHNMQVSEAALWDSTRLRTQHQNKIMLGC